MLKSIIRTSLERRNLEEMNKRALLSPKIEESAITFTVEGQDLLVLRPNGEIYVKGNLATTDLEVVNAMREFLQYHWPK
jgi:hypothetical protein